MSDIIEEIKKDVEQERWMHLWKKYQNHVYGFVTAIIVVTAASVWWQNQTSSKIASQSNSYIQALMLSESDPERALKIFERIPAKGETVYATLSRFWVASMLLERGDSKGAKSLYDIIYRNSTGLFTSSKMKAFGQLSFLRRLYIDVDSVDPQTIIQKVTPYAQKDSPWKDLANELLGLAYLKKGDKEKSKEYFGKIVSDPKIPSAFKIRSQAVINYLNTESK
jgi:hypothetical protein